MLPLVLEYFGDITARYTYMRSALVGFTIFPIVKLTWNAMRLLGNQNIVYSSHGCKC